MSSFARDYPLPSKSKGKEMEDMNSARGHPTTEASPSYSSPSTSSCYSSHSKGVKTAVIVGAGAAGLAAAKRLCDSEEFTSSSLRVVVLEARDGPGGRIKPIPVPANLLPDGNTEGEDVIIADGGANWIHGLTEANPFYTMTKNLGLVLYPTSSDDDPTCADCSLSVQGTTLTDEEFSCAAAHWKAICDGLQQLATTVVDEADAEGLSLADAIRRVSAQYWAERSPSWYDLAAMRWFASRVGIAVAADLERISFLTWTRSPEDGADGEALVASGLGRSLLPDMVREVAGRATIHYNTVVRRLLTRGGGGDEGRHIIACSGVSGGGATLFQVEADYLILTCPPPALKRLLQQQQLPAEGASVEPHQALGGDGQREAAMVPVPRRRVVDALSRLDMGVMDVVLLRFRQRWWPNDKMFFGIAPDDDDDDDDGKKKKKPLFTTFLNVCRARDDGAPLLMAQVYGSAAISTLEHMSNEQIADAAFASLQSIFSQGEAAVVDVLERPIGCVVHKWGSDEFAGGSWTVAGPGCTLDDLDALGVPFFLGSGAWTAICGESTISQYFGTIHGAYISGLRAADDLLSYHRPHSVSYDQ